jgi:RHS repeat-associated protein
MDAAGRMASVTTPRTTIQAGYHPTSGRLASLADSAGASLAFTYDGPLVKSVNWTGPVSGQVQYTYDSDFRLSTLNIAGQSFAFGYDPDGLLTSAGSLVLTRNPATGFLAGTMLAGAGGTVSTTVVYNEYGEPSLLSASWDQVPLYSQSLERDHAGRVQHVVETVQGESHTYVYQYDLGGRLSSVVVDGIVRSEYGYNANGSRTSAKLEDNSVTATYDAQDRLSTYGDATYIFGPNGDLQQRKRAGEANSTHYVYDAAGNLVAAMLSDGTQIEYIIDAQNRRIGKKANGTLTRGFIYDGQFRIVAELDGNNAVVSRFIYATQKQSPDYLIKDGVTYGIVKNHLGSVRLVINTSNGAVAQRRDYDEWGNTTLDTNPGFQPFGFAGGLNDLDTQIVRFGSRDYDSEVGRWTHKDSIGFEGETTNLYEYVENRPLDFIDMEGTSAVIPMDSIDDWIMLPVAGAFVLWCYVTPECREYFAPPPPPQPSLVQPTPDIPNSCEMSSEHTKNPRPSNWDKHTKKRPGAPEKGDARRRPGLQKPKGRKGPWPPKPPKTEGD